MIDSTEQLLTGLPTEKLSPEQENDCATLHDLERLILHNMREGFFYARHVCRGRLPEDEVYSLVYAALAHAAKNYRPGTKISIRFFAYAKPYIRGGICRAWRAKDVVKNSKGEESIEADANPASESDIELSGDENQKWEVDQSVEPEFDSIHISEQFELLKPLVQTVLSDQERMVIELKYFGHYNFEEIGRQLGVTRSAIQNCHARALRKLRGAITRQSKLFNE